MMIPNNNDVTNVSDVSKVYKLRVERLLAMNNLISWSIDKLAEELNISDRNLEDIYTYKLVSLDIVEKAESIVKPLAEQKLNAAKKRVAEREEREKVNNYPEFALKVRKVNELAKTHNIPLSLVLGVSKRTLEKWVVGYSMPQGFTQVVIESLYEDFDKNIKHVMELNPISMKA